MTSRPGVLPRTGFADRNDIYRGAVPPVQRPAWFRNYVNGNTPLPALQWGVVGANQLVSVGGGAAIVPATNFFRALDAYVASGQPNPDNDPANHSGIGGGIPEMLNHFTGVGVDTVRKQIFISMGGHDATWLNACVRFPYGADDPSAVNWVVWAASSPWSAINYPNSGGYPHGPFGVFAYNDGRPASVQNGFCQFLSGIGYFLTPGGTATFGGGGGYTAFLGPFIGTNPSYNNNPPAYLGPSPQVYPDSNSWDPTGVCALGESTSMCQDITTGTVYFVSASQGGVFKWNPTPGAGSMAVPVKIGNYPAAPPLNQIGGVGQGWIGMCIDRKRNRLILIGQPASQAPRSATIYAYIDIPTTPGQLNNIIDNTANVTGSGRATIDNTYTYQGALISVPPGVAADGGDYYVGFNTSALPNIQKIVPSGPNGLTWTVTNVTPGTTYHAAPNWNFSTAGGQPPAVVCNAAWCDEDMQAIFYMHKDWKGFGSGYANQDMNLYFIPLS